MTARAPPMPIPQAADWPDNPRRFAALSWIAARIGTEGIGRWRPEVVHAHDWQAGLTPVYLSEMGAERPGSVLTIHNMAFHGHCAGGGSGGTSPAGTRGFGPDGLRVLGKGFQRAEGRACLVGPDYHGVAVLCARASDARVRRRAGRAPDERARSASPVWHPQWHRHRHVWNPGQLTRTVANFKSPGGKKRAKRCASRRVRIARKRRAPLCVVVSRLSDQKGLDILLEALPALVDRGGQLALLGSGRCKALEARYRAAAAEHPESSLSISAMTRPNPTGSSPAATRSSCRLGSSPAVSPSSTASATAPSPSSPIQAG